MNLSLLRTLVTVSETESLAEAAQRLNLTPAAIHKQLKLLEAEFGLPLYEKAGRGIRMNAAAALLLPYAESALAQIATARQAIEEFRGLRRGLVRIGTGPTLSTHWLPRLLEKFRMMYPSVVVTVESGASEELLTNTRLGRTDLALLLAQEGSAEPGFDILAKWDTSLLFVTADRSIGKRIGLRSLAATPFIGPRKGNRMDAIVARHFGLVGVEPNVVMRLDNADAIRAVLRTGLGFALLPAWTLGEDLASGRLRTVRLPGPPPAAAIQLVKFAGTVLAPAAQEFARLTRAQAAAPGVCLTMSRMR